MRKLLPGWFMTIILMACSLTLGLIIPNVSIELDDPAPEILPTQVAQAATATETLLPASPLPTLTPAATLKPPPTLEPPTSTPQPSLTPSITPTVTLQVNLNIPGIQGAESPTPTTTPGCVVRDDWQLIHVVQFNEALASIAQLYGTFPNELAEANCISNPNVIQQGRELRVPGDVPTGPPPEQVCEPYEIFTPVDYAFELPSTGQIVFHWDGTASRRTLIRVYPPDNYLSQEEYWLDELLAEQEGTVLDTDEIDNSRDTQEKRERESWPREYNIDIRQNHAVSMDEFPYEGGYVWWIIPLTMNFQQICPSAGPYNFHKVAAPTPVPSSGGATTGGSGTP
ncbi:MAG: LysM peptidoglycan-binding domain-containing protein [Aggregatilineales bacterium]